MARKKKSDSGKVGRPTVITEETVRKLVEAFQSDFTTDEACSHAGIGRTTFYDHYDKDEDFRTKIDSAKAYLFTYAKKNIARALKTGSIRDSWEFLRTRQREIYSERSEVESSGELSVVIQYNLDEEEPDAESNE